MKSPEGTGTDERSRPEDGMLNELLLPTLEQSLFRSLARNIKWALCKREEIPLDVTSTPVPAKEIWGLYTGHEKRAGILSIMVHASAIALLFWAGTNTKVQQLVKEQVTLIAPDIAPYLPAVKKNRGGGGGGGDRSPMPASKGKLPKLAARQFVPPMAVVRDQNPKLVMDPTLIIQPDANIPKIDMDVLGDPLSKSGIASNGPGSGGGIGTGSGGGVGPGWGPGFGPGHGGGIGGGAYQIGGGVSAPAVLFKVEPEYSEEARKARFQGTVLLVIVVDERGNPRDIRVIRPAGLGLDEKALQAVQQWRFSPGKKDGRPVAVQAMIEVNFRLL